ncbi:MAG: hypothetical protein HYU64_02655 [Armatimonadetes bacterium]|nr:hypothetical protein [Armatimonadota bacterium]
MFKAQILFIFRCAHCKNEMQWPLASYLKKPITHCPHCGANMIHFAKGDLKRVREQVDLWEGNWTAVVNENLISERKE